MYWPPYQEYQIIERYQSTIVRGDRASEGSDWHLWALLLCRRAWVQDSDFTTVNLKSSPRQPWAIRSHPHEAVIWATKETRQPCQFLFRKRLVNNYWPLISGITTQWEILPGEGPFGDRAHSSVLKVPKSIRYTERLASSTTVRTQCQLETCWTSFREVWQVHGRERRQDCQTWERSRKPSQTA